MKPSEPTPVKLVCAVLYSDTDKLTQALAALEERYGTIDWQSQNYPFAATDYYLPEMGAPIYRLFYSFRDLVNPKELARIKIECNEIEDRLADDGRRKVNLDPGYLDYDKFVLASAKYAGHKIYLDLGIYADATLRYRKGKYEPSAFCFPDFKSGEYEELFLQIRAIYKKQLHQ
jgi:hypothetical protein